MVDVWGRTCSSVGVQAVASALLWETALRDLGVPAALWLSKNSTGRYLVQRRPSLLFPLLPFLFSLP